MVPLRYLGRVHWRPAMVPLRYLGRVHSGAADMVRPQHRRAVLLARDEAGLGHPPATRRVRENADESLHEHDRGPPDRRRRALGAAGTAGGGEPAAAGVFEGRFALNSYKGLPPEPSSAARVADCRQCARRYDLEENLWTRRSLDFWERWRRSGRWAPLRPRQLRSRPTSCGPTPSPICSSRSRMQRRCCKPSMSPPRPSPRNRISRRRNSSSSAAAIIITTTIITATGGASSCRTSGIITITIITTTTTTIVTDRGGERCLWTSDDEKQDLAVLFFVPATPPSCNKYRHCEEQRDEAIHRAASGKMDCFAEPVIGRRFAPTRWLAMTVFIPAFALQNALLLPCLFLCRAVQMAVGAVKHGVGRRRPFGATRKIGPGIVDPTGL